MTIGPDSIRRSHANGIVILHPLGRIDSASAPAFEAALVRAVTEAPVRAVVDLAGVEEVTSTGLRALLVAAKRARAAHSRIILAAMVPAVREALAGGGVLSLFETHPSVDDAIRGVR